MTSFFHAIPGGNALMLTGLASTTMTAVAWWRDCIIESDMGMHTEVGCTLEHTHMARVALRC
jgi:cytochrome c oxidase subunit 3